MGRRVVSSVDKLFDTKSDPSWGKFIGSKGMLQAVAFAHHFQSMALMRTSNLDNQLYRMSLGTAAEVDLYDLINKASVISIHLKPGHDTSEDEVEFPAVICEIRFRKGKKGGMVFRHLGFAFALNGSKKSFCDYDWIPSQIHPTGFHISSA